MDQTRRTLIVTEKPHQARNIAPHWVSHYPNDTLLHFHTPPMGSFKFSLPRDLPLSSVPIIRDPVLQRRPAGELTLPGTTGFGEDFGAMARYADHIVCATDYDPAGCRNFLDLMDHYEVPTPLSKVTWLGLLAEDPVTVKAGIARDWRADHPDFIATAMIGRARQYFDNLYVLNALPVFGRTLALAGIDPIGDAGFLSKYTLQMLLMLTKIPEPLTGGDLIGMMSKNPLALKRSPLGSPTSRHEIFYWLANTGCIEISEQDPIKVRAKYVLSERGHRLVRLIHKDCFDPHLCSRLASWGETWPESKPAVDQYIRRFFGKQKRFLQTKT